MFLWHEPQTIRLVERLDFNIVERFLRFFIALNRFGLLFLNFSTKYLFENSVYATVLFFLENWTILKYCLDRNVIFDLKSRWECIKQFTVHSKNLAVKTCVIDIFL